MKKGLLMAVIACICFLIISVTVIHFDTNSSTVSSLVHHDPPSEFCYDYVSQGYSQTLIFTNRSAIQEFHNALKNKIAKRQYEGMPAKEKTILNIDYGYKGNTISVDAEGRVFISEDAANIRNKSRLYWLWWKLDTNSNAHLIYRTEPDKKVSELAQSIKTYIEDDIKKKENKQ